MGCNPGSAVAVGGRLSLRRPIILVGLPGAGKSSVAPSAAGLLNAPWCDIDHCVATAAGQSVAAIFAEHGESHFRALEREAMRQALADPPQIIAAGGGWAAEPGNLAAIAGQALVIYLSIAPEEAARRLLSTSDRPLLADELSGRRMAELLAEREHWYRLADLEIAVGTASPDVVAAGVATAARQYAGW